jgi:hypothetical protein
MDNYTGASRVIVPERCASARRHRDHLVSLILIMRQQVIALAKTLIVCTTWFLYASTSLPASAEFVDHEAGCRRWEEIALRIYDNHQTKYKTILGMLGSQARDEEARARAQGWNEENIQHLLRIVSDAASGQVTTMKEFGRNEFVTCMEAWRSISTPEQRAAEAQEKERREVQAIADSAANNPKLALPKLAIKNFCATATSLDCNLYTSKVTKCPDWWVSAYSILEYQRQVKIKLRATSKQALELSLKNLPKSTQLHPNDLALIADLASRVPDTELSDVFPTKLLKACIAAAGKPS